MEGFRILEITKPSELHVTANQLTIEQEKEGQPGNKRDKNMVATLEEIKKDVKETLALRFTYKDTRFFMASGTSEWWYITKKENGEMIDVGEADSFEELWTKKLFYGKCIEEIFDEIMTTIDVN